MTSSLLVGDVERLGVIAVDLAANMPAWTRRRKTTYSFIDADTVLHRRSIDLILPDADWFPGGAPDENELIYVPLGIAEKDTLAGFGMTDRNGAAVSVLSTHENGQLATAGFNALIDGYLASRPLAAHAFKQPLRRIVTAPNGSEGARELASAMEAGLAAVLSTADQYRTLLEDLSTGFMVLVGVPYKPGVNHLFKLEWTQSYLWSSPGVGGGLRALAASLGLVNKELTFARLEVGGAFSTIFEFIQPEDVRILRTTLAIERLGAEPQTVGPRPHVVVNARVVDPQNPIANRSDRGTVRLALRSRRGGSFLAIVVLGWLTVIALWAVTGRLAELDAQTTSAVILVLPAVLSAYLIRQGEHAIAGRLLAGVRGCGLGIAGMALVAAMLIGVGDLRRDPVPRPSTLHCSTVSATLGPHPEPVPTVMGMRCDVPAAKPLAARASHLRGVVEKMSVAATALALLLSIGALSTWYATRKALRLDRSVQSGRPEDRIT